MVIDEASFHALLIQEMTRFVSGIENTAVSQLLVQSLFQAPSTLAAFPEDRGAWEADSSLEPKEGIPKNHIAWRIESESAPFSLLSPIVHIIVKNTWTFISACHTSAAGRDVQQRDIRALDRVARILRVSFERITKHGC